MGTMSLLSRIDPRIDDVCRDAFPDSPEFAAYLTERIRSLDGSVELARILCRTLILQSTSPPPKVTAECVQRLAVDTVIGAVGNVNRARAIGPHMIAVHVMVFLTQLSGEIRVPDRFRSVDALRINPRDSIDTKGEKKVAYVRLFCCASAMLAGVETDPRKQAA